MRELRFIVLALTGLIILSGCNDEYGKNLLKLDKDEITLNHKDEVGTVQLTSGTVWEVSGMPDWIEINPATGDNSTKISITAKENHTFEQRTATLIFTNGHLSKTLIVRQLSLQEADPFIKLAVDDLQTGSLESESAVELTTNRAWKIQDIPEWMSVAPVSGEKSALLTIKIRENRGLDTRSAQLTLTAESITKNLIINQYGIRNTVIGPYLPIFKLDKIEYSSKLNPSKLSYFKAENSQMFVNPDSKDKIYLGNLVSHNIGKGVDIHQFTGYTFKPIAVSSSAPVYSRTFNPSLAKQTEYVQHIISQKPKQILSFTADNGTTEFYSYRQLYAVGMANLGVKLDEVVSGNSYAQKEMPDKYGLIFSFKLTAFSLDMDIPEDGTGIHEKLTDTDKNKGVSYINSICYGKVGLLVVQYGTDSQDVKVAINKFIKDETLSPSERTLIESADICYVYFDNHNRVKTVKGNINAAEAYKTALKTIDFENIYPVTFSVADFSTHAANAISYSMDIP